MRVKWCHEPVPPEPVCYAFVISCQGDEQRTSRADAFRVLCESASELCVKLVGCANRGFVYDLYPYVWELQGLLNCLNSFISWLGAVL